VRRRVELYGKIKAEMKRVLIILWMVGISTTKWGSGDMMEDSDVDIDLIEGSGEEDYEELKLVPDKHLGETDIHFESSDRYTNDEYNEALMNYAYEYTEGEDDDSVLKITKDTFMDIEIKPKPSDTEEASAINTSQILIMVVSAFVSFVIVMLTYYMCLRTIANKKQKFVPFVVGAPIGGRATTSIVKDYRRVPTDTQEYLKHEEKILVNVSREKETHKPLMKPEQ